MATAEPEDDCSPQSIHDAKALKQIGVLASSSASSAHDEEDHLPPPIPLGARHLLSDGAETQAVKRISTLAGAVNCPPSNEFHTGQNEFPRIIGYEIHEVLGRGGMGVVYRATENRLQRVVALKILPSIRNTPEARARFEAEARLLAQVDNPRVARVFEIGSTSDGPYIAMEFIPGQSLDRYAGGKPLDPRQAASISRDLTIALHSCHQLGIIHRDVKPANALILPAGDLKLTDFGLAKLCGADSEGLTKSGDILGTPSYMAPEQASGVIREFGPTTDVYGAGAVLYELLTGRPPFAAPDAMQTMLLALTEAPISPRSILPKIPRDLETICLQCLEKKPARRYQTCEVLAEDLGRFLRGEAIVARPSSTARKVWSWAKRHPAWSFAIALSLFVVVAALGGISLHNAALQAELTRTQKLAREGQELSNWLMTDFSPALDGDEGVTNMQAKLAARTQLFLDALNSEVADDQLKIELARSLMYLANVQGRPGSGSLGQADKAQVNLASAQKIIDSLAHLQSAETNQLRALVGLRLAEYLIEEHVGGDPSPLLAEVRRRIFDSSGRVVTGISTATQLELLRLEIQNSQHKGNLDLANQQLAELEKVAAPLLAQQEELDGFARLFSELTYAKYGLFDVQNRNDELIAPLQKGLARLSVLSQGKPASAYAKLIEANLRKMLGELLLSAGELNSAEQEFHRMRLIWDERVDRDPKNQGAKFNLALAWELLAQTAITASKMEKAGECLEQARNYYDQFAALGGLKWQEHPETRHLLGLLANWHLQQNEFDKAREANRMLLETITKGDATGIDQRLRVGDARVQRGMIEAMAYMSDASNSTSTPSSPRNESYDRAVQALTESATYYEELKATAGTVGQAEKMLSRVHSTLEYIQAEHQKSLGNRN